MLLMNSIYVEWTVLSPLFGPVHCLYQGVWLVLLLLLYFIEISVFNANSVNLDQTPHVAASDLGLHCLPITLWEFPD